MKRLSVLFSLCILFYLIKTLHDYNHEHYGKVQIHPGSTCSLGHDLTG